MRSISNHSLGMVDLFALPGESSVGKVDLFALPGEYLKNDKGRFDL